MRHLERLPVLVGIKVGLHQHGINYTQRHEPNPNDRSVGSPALGVKLDTRPWHLGRGWAMERDVVLDEFVEFRLYPDQHQVGDDFLSLLRTTILSLVKPSVSQYIWHEGLFDLECCPPGKLPSHLHGRVSLGAGLEDEWFVTQLLFEISQMIPGLIISVADSDGDFILIETAESLPVWLEPDTSENRTFIFAGNFHIVDINDVRQPSLSQVLEYIRQNPSRTRASASIQKAIKDKLHSYSEGKTQAIHRSRVVLPRRLAQLLASYPQSISAISGALASATPREITRASLLPTVRSDTGELDLVSVRVAFSRLQFAQSLCAKLYAPGGYPMPSESSPHFLAHSLGVKLAVGAELAIAKESRISLWTPSSVELESLDNIIGKGSCDQFWDVCSVALVRVMEEVVAEDKAVPLYTGPDDDLSWLDVEEGPVLNSLADKMSGLCLSEQDAKDIVQKMIDEEDNPSLSSRLMEFMKATSGLEGIYYDPVTHLSDDDQSSSSTEDDDESPSDTEDNLFAEREILEAILHDPDLLMKILERGEDWGMDCRELVERMQHVDREALLKRPERPQKGIADIDPEKMAEARRRVRPLPMTTTASPEAESTEDSSDGEEKDVYHEEPRPPRTANEQEIRSDSDSNVEIDEYMDLMDAELKKRAIDREELSPERDFRESMRADSSPSHAVLLGLMRK